MFKFGMSDYEIQQNAPGVLIANLLAYGAIAGAAGVTLLGLVGFGLYKVLV